MTTHNTHEEPRALVIGDVHGKFDHLHLLLEREGIIKEGTRVKNGVEVIQLGDLGDFRKSSFPSDKQCYEALRNGWIDYLLWGNHDRAVRDERHAFSGFYRPSAMISHMMRMLEIDKRLKMAMAIHGYLLTHAGLHPQFDNAVVPEGLNKYDPYDVADYLNQDPEKFARVDLDEFINNIGRTRGGMSFWGGILWRDNRDEPLYHEFPQVFGHTSSDGIMVDGKSYCVDTSKSGKVSAIWLPDKKIVSVSNDDVAA